jgi:hypothetical protein
MSRYPAALSERGWASLMKRLGKPTSEAYRRSVLKMIENGKKLKVYL